MLAKTKFCTRPSARLPLRPCTRRQASALSEFVTAPGVYYTSKAIILFTMFYCTLNWAHYRSLSKKEDDDDQV